MAEKIRSSQVVFLTLVTVSINVTVTILSECLGRQFREGPHHREVGCYPHSFEINSLMNLLIISKNIILAASMPVTVLGLEIQK